MRHTFHGDANAVVTPFSMEFMEILIYIFFFN